MSGKTPRAGSDGGAFGRRQWFILGGVVLSIIAITLGAWWVLAPRGNSFDPAAGVRVEYSIPGVPQGLRIGVVVSYTEDLDQGAGWDGNGEGITVAKWRLAQSGIPVDTVVVSDQGSDQGAAAAVKELVEAKVSGIVALSRGPHTSALVAAASEAGLPIVLPYENTTQDRVDYAWYGVEQLSDWTRRLGEQSKELGCAPLVSVGKAPTGLNVDGSTSGDDIAKEVSDLLGESRHGCVIMNGPGAQMASQVQLLRAEGISVPIIVGTGGANSEFLTRIGKAGASGGMIYSLGNPTLVSAPSWVGFDQARSLAKRDANLVSLQNENLFGDRADLSDADSYEAFMSLVRASAQASSTDPGKVGQALARLRLEASQAVDGLARDFTSVNYKHSQLVQLVPAESRWQWTVSK